ncbi:hypothetical protein WDW86_02675 [Bdellovibrionota bacterium FG-2]
MKMLILLVLISQTSLAASELVIPKSELNLSSASKPRREQTAATLAVQISTTNFTPAQLVWPTQIAGTTSFQSATMPPLSISLLPLLSKTSSEELRWIAEVSYSLLERQAALNASIVSQNVSITSLGVGLEIKPRRLSYKRLSSFASASLQPTMISAASSALGSAASDFGISAMIKTGIQGNLPLNLQAVGVSQSFLTLGGGAVVPIPQRVGGLSGLEGVGILAGIRMEVL